MVVCYCYLNHNSGYTFCLGRPLVIYFCFLHDYVTRTSKNYLFLCVGSNG